MPQVTALQAEAATLDVRAGVDAAAIRAAMDRIRAEAEQAAATAERMRNDAARLRAIADELAAMVPEPPPPEPEPLPTPTLVFQGPVNRAALILPEPFYPGCFERYDRQQAAVVLKTSTWKSAIGGVQNPGLYICSVNQEAGGAPAAWGYPVIALEMSGREIGRITAPLPDAPAAAARLMQTTIPEDLADGWHAVVAVGYDAQGVRHTLGARAPQRMVGLDRHGGLAGVDHFYIQSGNYDWVRTGGPTNWIRRVPKALIGATPKPIAPRAIVSFDTALDKSQIWRTNRLPVRHENTYRPSVTRDGVIVAEQMQGYFFNDIIRLIPRLPRLDGPRGVASLFQCTDIKIGRDAKIYCNYGSGVARVEADGLTTTLFGRRHTRATEWRDAGQGVNGELVGDWRVTPAGMGDSWGFAFVKASLALDEAAAPIDGEQPHLVGPYALVADPIHDRVLRVTFAHNARQTPNGAQPVPVITLCASFPGGDPWDLVIDENDVAYVALRKASRIARIDARTCAAMPDLAANDSGLGVVLDTQRIAHAGGTLDQRRAAKVLGPEGIDLQSDGNVVVASSVQEAVYVYDRNTGARTFRAYPPRSTAGKSLFSKIAVCRSGFGPADTLFVATWSEQNMGRPHAILPVDATGVAKGWDWHGLGVTAEGHTGTKGGIYTAAVGCAPGMLATATAEEGIEVYTRRGATDNLPDVAAYARGNAEYVAKGYRLLHGEHGYSFLKAPLPCGESADMDVYLRSNGHCR